MTPGTDALSDGDEVLIAIEDRKAGKFYFVQCGSTKHLEQSVSDGIVSNPNAATIWIATASSTNWQFRKKGAASNGYLYNSGSNTTLATDNASAATWYVGNGSSGSPAYKYFKIQQGSNSGRYVSWSGSTFAAYANSNWSSNGVQGSSSNLVQYNGALQIFKKVVPASAYTVTLKDNDATLTETSAGAGVTLPSRTGCDGYTFAGWTKSWTSAQTSWTTTAPTIIPAGAYAPTANEDLYPVYTKTSAGGTKGYTVTTTLTVGKTYVFGAVKAAASASLANNTTFGAVAFTNTYNSTSPNWGQKVDLTPNSSGILTGSDTTNLTSACKWVLQSISSGNYTFKNGSNYIYLGTLAGSTTNGAQSGVSTSSGNMYLENVTGTCKDAFLCHPASDNTNIMLYNTSNGYRMYAVRSYSSSMTPYVRFYEYNPGSVTSYISVPNCCTPLASINGSFNSGTQKVTWDAVTDASGYKVKVENSSHATVTDWTDNGSTREYSTAGLTCGGLTYYVYVKAYNNDNPGHCTGDGPSSDAITVTTAACTEPAVTLTPTSLTGLNYIVGQGPSTAQSFVVKGSNLTGALTVTPNSNYEICLTNSATPSDWKSGSTTLSIAKANAEAVSGQTVYVRLKSGLSVGDYNSQSITISGGGLASNATETVSGTVLKPTIVADPTSITGWNAETGSAPSPATKTVSVTGTNLKANITATLTSGSTYFSIDNTSFTETSGSASGTITISVLAAAYASAGTREGIIRLSTTDGDNVDVSIQLVVADDPRERFTLLTSSNIGQLSDGAKIVLVNDGRDRAMNQTQDGSNGHGYVQTGYEFLSSNTIIALATTNSVEVLTLEEQTNGYALKTLGNKYLKWGGGSNNKFSEVTALSDPVEGTEQWGIGVDNDGYATIRAYNTNNDGYFIGCNDGSQGGTPPTTSQFRAYSSAAPNYGIYAYFQPSTTPSVSLTSVSKMEYDYDDGPSAYQTTTLTARNLTTGLTVTAPANFEVSKSSGSGYETTPSTLSITKSEAEAGITLYIRLKSGLAVNTYAGNLSVSGTDLAEAKTLALSGEVNCLSYAAGPVLGAVTAVNSSATITWSAVSGASEYEVKLGDGSWTDANGSLSHSFTGLTCGGTSYTYYVRAKAATGYCAASAATSSTFTTGDCLCSSYSFHYGPTSGDWSYRCFSQVGSSTEWQIENFTIGSASAMNQFYVGYQNEFKGSGLGTNGAKSNTVTLQSQLFFAEVVSCDNRATVRSASNSAEGAVGTLRIYSDSNWDNLQCAFLPNGYGLMYGGSGASGNVLPFTNISTGVWETDVAVLTADMKKTDNTYKYQVGLATATEGTYVACGNSAASNFGDMGSYYSSDWRGNISTYNVDQAGKFQIWSNSCNNNNSIANWVCHFVPYYTINYYDLNDELIGTDYVAYGTANTTLRTTTGLGWKNVNTGGRSAAGDVTNAFGSSLTLNTSQPSGIYNFYLVATGYTVTFSVPACVTQPNSITGNSITLPASPGAIDGYTFAGWTNASVASTTTQPTLYAAGDTYAPTTATTLYACYYSSSGAGGTVTFDVLNNSAAITAGYYVLTPNKSGEAEAMYNTLYNNTKLNIVEVDGSGTTATMSATEEGAVWQFIADGDYWQIKNMANNKYLAAVDDANSNKIALVDAVSNNFAKWVINLRNGYSTGDTHTIYNVGKGSSGTGTDTKHWFLHQYTATSTEVWAANEIKDNLVATNGAIIYLFKASGTPSFGVTYTYTTSPTCTFTLTVGSPDNVVITATPSGGSAVGEGGTANLAENTTVTLAGTPSNCYGSLTWQVKKTSDNTDVTASVLAGTILTMPAYDVTVTASVSASPSYTITYSIPSGGGSLQGTEGVDYDVTACAGSPATLPNVTGGSLTCAKFVGWYDGSSYSSSSKPSSNYYAAGASYTPENNVTLKALYAIVGDNYELVTDKDNLVAGSSVVFAYRGYTSGSYYPVAMSETQQTDYRDVYDYTDSKVSLNAEGTIISWIEATPDVAEFTVEAGSSNGTYAFKDESGYIYCASTSSNGYLRTQANKDANASWTISISSGEAEMVSGSSQTRKYLWYNSSNDRFSCYANNYAGKKTSIFQRSVSSYTTSPACTTYSVSTCSPGPSNGTISVSAASVSPGGNVTVTFTPSANYMLDEVTVTSGTATVGTPSYSSGPTSGGTVSITNVQSDITVCATFVAIPLYTVTFVDVDNSNATQTVTQASYGANVTAPSTSSSSAHDPCDNTWTFVGWEPSNALSGGTTEPTGFIAAGGTINGASITGPTTYYSVYTNSSDGTTAFTQGKSGTYYFKAITTAATPVTLYATGSMSSNKYPSNQLTKIPFDIQYNSSTTKYTIKNTLTDLYLSPENGNGNSLVERAAAFEWSLETPDIRGALGNAASGEWFFSYINSASNKRHIYCDGTYFLSKGDGNFNDYALYLEPATSIYYYNASSCTDLVTMTFHPIAGGDPTWAEGHPKAEYTDVAKGTISVFPTDAQDGWTFLGWTAGQSYNDNREAAGETLDDDNASVTVPTQTIYSTGGNSYNLQANIDMYPVFTKFPDNEPFDDVNGGDYYIYYIADGDIATSQDVYGANNRIYASGRDNKAYTATSNCNDAALFTFTKLPNGKWTIYDNKNSEDGYKHYVCGEQTGSGNDLPLMATAANYGEWTITVHSGNQFVATCFDDYILQVYSTNATSGTFKNYAANNFSNDPGHYHRVYLGTCTERVYSSDPTNTPRVEIHGAIKVTATNGQMVKAVSALSVAGSNLATSTVTVASSSADFKLSTSVNSGTFAQSITIPVVSNKVAPTAVYVAYSPSETTDGINNTITVSVKDNPADPAAQATTTAGDIQGRHLPADFVIAAKTGSQWVALPSNLTGVVPQAYSVITVDNVSDPTKVTYAKATDIWNFSKVHDTNGAAQDRWGTYGSSALFVSDVDSKCLYATTAVSPTTGIGTYATAASYHSSNPLYYEWALNSSDLETYTLVNQNTTQTNKTLTYNPSTQKWGMYASGGSNIQEVRLLPVDNILADFKWDVMEWDGAKPAFSGATSASGSIYYKFTNADGTVPSGSATSVSYTRLSGDVVKPSSNMAIAANAGKLLMLFDRSSNPTKMTAIEIPHIVTSEETSSGMGTAYDGMDVVVRSGGQITANNKARSFKTLTVYPGGKVNIPTNTTITVKQLMIRGGYSFLDNSFAFPEIYLTGTGDLAGSANAIYDYFIDNAHFYLLTLPYDVNLDNVTDEIGYANFSSWVQYYDGATRASGDQVSGWVDYDGTDDSYFGNAGTSGTLTDDKFEKGRGYLLAARPRRGKSVDNYLMVRDRSYAIVRFPLGNADKINNSTNGELSTKTINVTAHGFTDGKLSSGVKPNNAGWNFVGNPFMSSFGGASSAESNLAGTSTITVGYLAKTPNEDGTNWNGNYEWKESSSRYITKLNPITGAYSQGTVTSTSVEPFNAFFIQTKVSGTLTFASAGRKPLSMPALKAQEANREIELELLLSDGESTDNTGLLIGNAFTEDYELGDDLAKVASDNQLAIYTQTGGYDLAFNAIPESVAAQPIPIGFTAPADGSFEISLKETASLSLLESVILKDNENGGIETDLLVDNYPFETTAAKQNNTRFTIVVKIKEEHGSATDIDATGVGEIGQLSVAVSGNGITLHGVPTDAVVFVYDMTGKLLYKQKSLEERMQLNVPQGVYNIRVQTPSEGKTLRAIVR